MLAQGSGAIAKRKLAIIVPASDPVVQPEIHAIAVIDIGIADGPQLAPDRNVDPEPVNQ